jgi:hypothetical protein
MIWFRRFSTFYLLVPPDHRSIDSAYARFRAEQAGSAQAAKPSRRAPGSWHEAAVKWRWMTRAESWDRHEIGIAQKARIRAVRETQKKHVAIASALLGRVLGRIQEIGFQAARDPLKLVTAARELINLERLVNENPLAAEEIRQAERDHEEKHVSEVSTWDVTPEDLVAVSAAWAELGISIHDDPPAHAAGPVAALSAPPTGPAGSQ